jgi:hypothetical protein
MKKSLGCLFVALALCFASAQAAPFIVSDSDPAGSVNRCVYQEGAATPVETATFSYACHIDTAGFSTGTHTLQIWFMNQFNVAGASVPFTFTKAPPPVPVPQNLRVE